MTRVRPTRRRSGARCAVPVAPRRDHARPAAGGAVPRRSSSTSSPAFETFGTGARGFNVYDGELREASFASITTHADAGVGIQVSRRIERLRVDGDVRTSGGIGKSLVKGRVEALPAYAVSIQKGGDVAELSIGGSLITEGEDVVTLQVQGAIDHIDIGGTISATGAGAEPVSVDGGAVDLSGVSVAS